MQTEQTAEQPEHRAAPLFCFKYVIDPALSALSEIRKTHILVAGTNCCGVDQNAGRIGGVGHAVAVHVARLPLGIAEGGRITAAKGSGLHEDQCGFV